MNEGQHLNFQKESPIPCYLVSLLQPQNSPPCYLLFLLHWSTAEKQRKTEEKSEQPNNTVTFLCSSLCNSLWWFLFLQGTCSSTQAVGSVFYSTQPKSKEKSKQVNKEEAATAKNQKKSTTQQPPDHEADNIQNNQAEWTSGVRLHWERENAATSYQGCSFLISNMV